MRTGSGINVICPRRNEPVAMKSPKHIHHRCRASRRGPRKRAVGRRAAQLQAEAQRRMEEARHRSPAGSESGDSQDDGLYLDDVRGAGEAAGISPEFVQIARPRAWRRPGLAAQPRDAVAACHLSSGSLSEKAAPSPSTLLTASSPPIARASSRLIASPSPAPCRGRSPRVPPICTNGWKIRSR